MSLSLLKDVNDRLAGTEVPQPAVPDGWNVGDLAGHGAILSCEGFQLKLEADELQKFFDIAESGDIGEVRDQNGHVVTVEPTDDSIVLTRNGDDVYPSGVVLDLKTLKEMGIEQDAQEKKDAKAEPVEEGTKAAYRRSGGKIKRGFRVTSGFRKGRIVAHIGSAFKPRAKASTRMKLRIASHRHKIVRVLKSKRTRKKSISKRLARMNAR